MTTLAVLLVAVPVATFAAAYVIYPAVLWVLVRVAGDTGPPWPPGDPDPWPRVSLLVPVYNEAEVIRGKIENLLALDYPPDRRQVVVVSDASDDGTDEIVQKFADRGVELVRVTERGGKTAAQNAAVQHLDGDIVVNTDATTRLAPDALKALIRPFQNPGVGVASGRNVSVGRETGPVAVGESRYVGYEMWVRELETRLGGIVGASGAYYAIRGELFSSMYPGELSRDFGTVLLARKLGYAAVTVHDAVCRVPRSGSIRGEMRRKTRTMTRGLETLWHFRELMNPFRFGTFSLRLGLHKLGRWSTYLFYPLGLAALGWLALRVPVAAALFVPWVVVGIVGAVGLVWPEEAPGLQRPVPRIVGLCGYFVAAGVAGAAAWYKALTGERNPIWEPTRRQDTTSASAMRG
ncbi:MAG: glycosyltransferase family 2 protein [Gemmatimonadota bacterium]|nr:glycosyltransferase family 2 protein [Gemmatimonadota bacterium]